MEIKSKLTVIRGEGEGDNRERRGRVKSRKCTKGPWTRTTGGGLNVGEGLGGTGESNGGK